jgi:mono/diheme cytochrome c family protein
MRPLTGTNYFVALGLLLAAVGPLSAADLPPANRQFIEKHCVECHGAETKKGDLNLEELKFDPRNSTNFSRWVLIHDRVSKGEMPPKKKPRPEQTELEAFTKSLSSELVSVERARMAKEGRATRRRMNRYEYENALRDLLHAPWLQVRDSLPEDGEGSASIRSAMPSTSPMCKWRGIWARRDPLREAMRLGPSRPGESPSLLCARAAQLCQQDEILRIQYRTRTRHFSGAWFGRPAGRAR